MISSCDQNLSVYEVINILLSLVEMLCLDLPLPLSRLNHKFPLKRIMRFLNSVIVIKTILVILWCSISQLLCSYHYLWC